MKRGSRSRREPQHAVPLYRLIYTGSFPPVNSPPICLREIFHKVRAGVKRSPHGDGARRVRAQRPGRSEGWPKKSRIGRLGRGSIALMLVPTISGWYIHDVISRFRRRNVRFRTRRAKSSLTLDVSLWYALLSNRVNGRRIHDPLPALSGSTQCGDSPCCHPGSESPTRLTPQTASTLDTG